MPANSRWDLIQLSKG